MLEEDDYQKKAWISPFDPSSSLQKVSLSRSTNHHHDNLCTPLLYHLLLFILIPHHYITTDHHNIIFTIYIFIVSNHMLHNPFSGNRCFLPAFHVLHFWFVRMPNLPHTNIIFTIKQRWLLYEILIQFSFYLRTCSIYHINDHQHH